jgi:hypothetical protein
MPQLDAGVSEQVLLQSRDERSLLVVSYADIKVSHDCCTTALLSAGWLFFYASST